MDRRGDVEVPNDPTQRAGPVPASMTGHEDQDEAPRGRWPLDAEGNRWKLQSLWDGATAEALTLTGAVDGARARKLLAHLK